MKKYLFLIFLLMIAAAGFIFWRFLQGPAIGTIRMGELPATVADEFDESKGWKSFQGAYIRLTYPAKYQKQEREVPKDGPAREIIFLTASDLESTKIAITVERRPDPGLEASPSYQARLNDKATYERSSLEWQGFSGMLFTKNAQVFEQTAFFRNGDLLLSVSATSPLRIDALSEELHGILQHLRWKTEE
jgi:hypothetical protein